MPQKKWNPKEYDQQSVLQYNTAMSMLDTLELKGDEIILDVGCGSGKTAYQIAKIRVPNGSIRALDVSPEMINFAKERYKANNLVFECTDVLKMKYKSRFNLIVSFWTLSWIPLEDQLQALHNIIEALVENGKIFLMYPLKHDIYAVVDEVIKRPRWKKYFINYLMPRHFITEEQYKLILSHISDDAMELSVVKKEIPCKYKDDREMVDSINCWLAHVDEIPSADKNDFLKEVAQAYKLYRNIEQPIIYYSTLEITGTKHSLECDDIHL